MKEAKSNDTRRRDAMMASGAQLLSTDFPRNEAADTGYVVQFGSDASVRCNPVLISADCLSHQQRDE
jgi:hypothetical protein